MTGTVDMSTAQALSPSYVNSFRISAVSSRLLVHLRGDTHTENTEFFNLCLSLARGIDYAVANNEIPGRAPDLPYLIKQVCQRKNESQLQAAIMVLMISVKSACSSGWFNEKEKEELHLLSEEMQSSFCSVNVKDMNSNMKNKESNLHPTISTIMSRYFPGMKMGEILCLVEAMTGYDSYVTDLHISKSARASTNDKIYLFVAQIDNIETSSCLISPQQVNFLLNGEGVERRTCIFRDPGPQAPTPVTHMLKYGSNLLQVVGQFNGRYIIVIAFMSVVSNPTCSPILDYVPVAAPAPDSDNEIIEGPSRISLKCPISFSRIKIPVKGHTCKHLQCFDFNNYVGINTRRPQWRCPHCSQSVSFHDIRIDQRMVKVLKEVGEDISHVKISSDGSWEAVTESNENSDKQNDAPPVHQDTSIQNIDDIMDLTEGDNNELDDKKPSVNNVNKNIAPHMEDGFWREFYSSSLPTRIVNTRPDAADMLPGRPIFNSMPGQSQSQSQNDNSINGNAHSRYPTHVLNVTRAPNTIQSLPAQTSSRSADVDRQQQNFSQILSNLQSARMSSQIPQQMGRNMSPLPPDRFWSQPPQSMNQRTPVPVPIRPSAPSPPAARPPGGGGGGGVGPNPMTSQSHYSLADIQRATNVLRTPSTPVSIQTPAPSMPVTSTGDQRDPGSSVDANWRPTGRMRGSLSGRAYSEALNQYIIHPNQPVQAARPPVLNTPRPFIPPHLQALMANNLRSQNGEGGGPDSDGGVLPDK
ncbi:unnamed protein product [Lactuca saligna]|uniref:SP-RING-type domain-containing protein n=1 Tax=Lactuca saligna TaxID=75948 RepID=A0AA35YIC5_LACSI|nr:unnamed protein product [Lactuca saligna]